MCRQLPLALRRAPAHDEPTFESRPSVVAADAGPVLRRDRAPPAHQHVLGINPTLESLERDEALLVLELRVLSHWPRSAHVPAATAPAPAGRASGAPG